MSTYDFSGEAKPKKAYDFSGDAPPPKKKGGYDFTAAVKDVAGKGVSALDWALNVQLNKTREAAYHGGSPDENRARARKDFGLGDGVNVDTYYKVAGSIPGVGHAIQGGIDLGLDYLEDPLTLETLGAGPLVKGGSALLSRAAKPLVRAATSPVGRTGPKIPASVRAQRAVDATGIPKGAGEVHDFFTHGGPAKRKFGVEGYDTAMGIESKAEARTGEGGLYSTVMAPLEKAMKSLSEPERLSVMKWMNGELPRKGLTAAAQAVTPVADKFRKNLLRLGRQFSSDIKHPVEELPNWFPGSRTSAETEKIGHAATPFNKLEGIDPHLLHREGSFVVEDAVRGMEQLRGAARDRAELVAREIMKSELTKAFKGTIPDEIRALFDSELPATGKYASWWKNAWRTLISSPKLAVVGVSPGHIANMISLAVGNPGGLLAAAKAVPKAGRLLAQPGKRQQILRESIEAGAQGENPERTTAMMDFISSKPLAARAGVGGAVGGAYGATQGDTPQERLMNMLKMGAGGAAAGAVAPAWMKGMNKATWAMDEALVDELTRASGKTGYAAGRSARKALVDYEHVSPFTKMVRNVMPFGTFNMGIPKAVLGGVAKNPARAAALDRGTGGFLYGSDVDTPLGRARFYGPTGEMGRAVQALDAPFAAVSGQGGKARNDLREGAKFARKSLAQPVDALAAILEVGMGRGKPFSTYGLDPTKRDDALKILASMASSGIPEAREYLNQIGYGAFKPHSIMDAILQQGGRTLMLR